MSAASTITPRMRLVIAEIAFAPKPLAIAGPRRSNLATYSRSLALRTKAVSAPAPRPLLGAPRGRFRGALRGPPDVKISAATLLRSNESKLVLLYEQV